MKGIDGVYKLSELLFGRGRSADSIVNVAAEKFRFWAVVLTKKLMFAVNSFHPALKYTWEISDTSLAFLDIKISTEGNGLCTSVYYKPTDSHSYLLYSSSHPSHVLEQ